MNAQMQTEDEKREDVIKRSREVLKASKTSIYCLHRLELQKAESHMDKAEKVARELLPITEEHPHLRFGILTSSLEEWAEAKVFHYFLVHGKIPTRKQLEIVNVEEFLGAYSIFCLRYHNSILAL
jgi:translin